MINRMENNIVINIENIVVDTNGQSDIVVKKEKIKVAKKRKSYMISDNDFTIPMFCDSLFLLKFNYKVSQLKEIARHYCIKISGNKSELKNRIYLFLFQSFSIKKIQIIWKRYIISVYNTLKGPARFNRGLCVNESDFLNMDSLVDVPYSQFFSYTDNCGQTYGFDILSLYNLYIKNNNKPTNPYNRQPFPSKVKTDIRRLLKINKMCGDYIKIIIDKPIEISPLKQLDFRILSVFHEIDILGNYTDITWFSSLQRVKLILFIRELSDIWCYRAQLSMITRREICPPVGNPFHGLNMNALPNMTFYSIKKEAINIIEHMVTRGINVSSKGLGANYVLCALTLVNTEAAANMPWLFQSVAH